MLRRLLESRMGRRGKREFVQVLRLVENFRKEEVCEAVRDALRLGAISFDVLPAPLPTGYGQYPSNTWCCAG